MKLLRTDLDESTLGKLSEAVQQADRYNLPYSDSNIEQQVDVWMEGLVANEQVRGGTHRTYERTYVCPAAAAEEEEEELQGGELELCVVLQGVC